MPALAPAGANAGITQYFYNADAYFRFRDDCDALGVNVPIVPGIMPIANFTQLARFSDACGAEIPRWMRLKLQSFGDDRASIRSYGLDVVTELWRPITPRINAELLSQGFIPLSPEQLQAVVRAADDAIRDEAPEWDPETLEWWAAALEDASPDDPCPDPWRCQHCGEPWHTSHPEYRQLPAVAAYTTELRMRFAQH